MNKVRIVMLAMMALLIMAAPAAIAEQGDETLEGVFCTVDQGPSDEEGESGEGQNKSQSLNVHFAEKECKENWTPLFALDDLEGDDGQDGKDGEDGDDGKDGWEIELDIIEGSLSWRYVVDNSEWTDLIDVDELGSEGPRGPAGEDGQDGDDGREIELDVIDNVISWRYVGDDEWTDLIHTDNLSGGGAGDLELDVIDGMIVWRIDGGDWHDLINVDELRPSTPQPDSGTHRLGGPERIATSVEVSQFGWADGSNTVVLATAAQFPDALTGSAIGAKFDAPVLLTYPDELHPLVADEIQRLDPDSLLIIGESAAVSDTTETEARTLVNN